MVRKAPQAQASILERAFGPPCISWFREALGAPTPVQEEGWRHIAAGEHALLLAPTGSGKTLAAFFWAIDQLVRLPADAPEGVRVLYISPLKALVTDIERNLRAPLVGVARHAAAQGLTAHAVEVGMRTGDTPAQTRAQQRRRPPHILVTTPESLFLLLGSQASAQLKRVHTVIVDEIHAVAASKRGAHLALSLERLEALCAAPPQRIGLSATVRPVAEVARFLGGQRTVRVVDRQARPNLHLRLEVPVANLDALPPPPATKTPPAPAPPAASAAHQLASQDSGSLLGQLTRSEAPGRPAGQDAGQPNAPQGLWAFIVPRLYALLCAHRTTLIFVNSRGACERLANQLNALAEAEPEAGGAAAAAGSWVRAHHGSVSLKKRQDMEAALKAGQLRGIVATSSLELGIDMGSIDLVVMVESPGSVARGLQRIGRAGHGVGQTSHGVILPKHALDLLEAAVIAGRMREGLLEPVVVPQNPLDVLAQHLVALCAQQTYTVAALHQLVRQSFPFHGLSMQALAATLDMLTGHYPSDEFSDLRPLLRWDRAQNLVSARKGARLAAVLNAGTIPDRGTYGVFLADGGHRVGELDEEMVHESSKGDVFLLGASSWRIEQITRDKILVSPAPGEPGKLPFWRGEGPGRPLALGQGMGAWVRRLEDADDAAWRRAGQELGLDTFALQNLRRLFAEQRAATHGIPHDEHVVVEHFRDALGDWRICILTPLGARVHAPWALVLEGLFAEQTGHEAQMMANDDGICIRLPGQEPLPDLALLFCAPEALEERVMAALAQSALFAGAFRENAARALLLPRRRAQGRTPLWLQRLRSKTLLAAAQRYPSFPMVLETYRQCLRDTFDVPALTDLFAKVQRRQVRVRTVATDTPSPFARALAYAYVATYLYQGDAPLAERRAQALTLDRTLLRSLMGEVPLGALLDAAAIAEVHETLQFLAADRRATDADALHDMLRLLGDLTEEEMAARTAVPKAAQGALGDAAPVVAGWLAQLSREQRAFCVQLGGSRRWLASQWAANYRDALGVVPPQAVAVAWPATATPAAGTGAETATPLAQCLGRYARRRGPFVAAAAADRYGLALATVEAELNRLSQEGTLVAGELLPGQPGTAYCDAEVLRRIKQRTLARLRNEVSALPAGALVRFLRAWQGLDTPRRGPEALLEVLRQLTGLPLPFSVWCQEVLPARVTDFQPDMLDLLCAGGRLTWVGAGALGSRDGRVAFYPREQLALLHAAPAALPEKGQEGATIDAADAGQAAPADKAAGLPARLLTQLRTRGAAFTLELISLAEGPRALEQVQEALWDLVWAGLISNDTVQPLRALGHRYRGPGGVGGRWWALPHQADDAAATDSRATEERRTAQAHARAHLLLARYGVASRQAALAEDVPGGFTPIYQLLKVMEEAGQVRRGLFVAGLGGAQFAFAGAVERLRAGHRAAEDKDPAAESAWALAAADPANPYGLLLPWPERLAPDTGGPLRRVAGAKVLGQGGQLLAYLEANGQALTLFASLRQAPNGFAALVQALGRVPRTSKGRSLRLQRIDGQPALQHADTPALLEAGLKATYDGLLLDEAHLTRGQGI